ncbi:hypothetical protein RIF23_02425 [Lipingzhangella sp. LS1_29]|uniref:Uncharacterized protein n=1 Tax=Lipingzhangella rawalii TaxID=2055835 RepID=A0ABU2H1H3_9ACTN|nr:hypothetical protein [Lipingzhangella rawalii]MDS1269148.1 hypothetical protein [Lipingzhangella rawalii]
MTLPAARQATAPILILPEEHLSTPLADTDPRQLGAYRLRGRLETHPAGIVYTAIDAGGHSVHVAMLNPGAAADPAVRSRFTSAVTAAATEASVPRILAASTRSTATAWAALPAHSPTMGIRLLDTAAALDEVDEVTVPAGPTYTPHWTASDQAAAPHRWDSRPAPGAPPATHRPHPGVVLGLVAMLLLLITVLVPVYLALSSLRPDPAVETVPAPSPQPAPESPDDEDNGVDEEDGGEEPDSVPEVPLDDHDITQMPTPAQSPEDLA